MLKLLFVQVYFEFSIHLVSSGEANTTAIIVGGVLGTVLVIVVMVIVVIALLRGWHFTGLKNKYYRFCE